MILEPWCACQIDSFMLKPQCYRVWAGCDVASNHGIYRQHTLYVYMCAVAATLSCAYTHMYVQLHTCTHVYIHVHMRQQEIEAVHGAHVCVYYNIMYINYQQYIV